MVNLISNHQSLFDARLDALELTEGLALKPTSVSSWRVRLFKSKQTHIGVASVGPPRTAASSALGVIAAYSTAGLGPKLWKFSGKPINVHKHWDWKPRGT